MVREQIRSLGLALEWLKREGLVLESDREANPKLEVAAIQERLDGGPPILFNKVKGYSNARIATNVMGSDRVAAKMFGCKDRKSLRCKIRESIMQPIAPKVVDKGPCHGVVIDKNIGDL